MSVLGFDPETHADEVRRRIGSQLQESALPDRLKVWEALDLFAALTPGGADWPVLMEQWGLTQQKNAAFSSLSGGQRQRLFIASASVNNPEVVFLDEMTTGLDPAARRVAWDLIEAVRARGTTVAPASHFMEEAQRRATVACCTWPHRGPRHPATAHRSSRRYVAGLVHHGRLRRQPWLGGVDTVERVTRRTNRVEVEGTGPVLAMVASALVEHGIAPPDLHVERPTLEDAFLALADTTTREAQPCPS